MDEQTGSGQLQSAPFDDAILCANKFLLHAADEASRGTAPIAGMTLEAIWACHKAILAVANRLSVAIERRNIGAVPTPQYDVLEHWSSAFMPEEPMARMLSDWQSQNETRRAWTHALFPKVDDGWPGDGDGD